ncbi:MAG: DUF3883 domain-containing protein [Acidimicrobiales bacterium]
MASYAMFVGNKAASNLEKALDHQTWGWTEIVAESPGQIQGGRSGVDRIGAPQVGDLLVIATGKKGASVRRDFDPDRRVVLERLLWCTVEQPLHRNNSPIWESAPDPYDYRIRFRVDREERDVDGDELGEGLMRALHSSSARGSTPFPFAEGPMPLESSTFVEAPSAAPRSGASQPTVISARDYLKEQERNLEIGELGEEFVVGVEKTRLEAAGRPDLAAAVDQVSKTVGDGLGYDVLSFNAATGDELHIEVKATTGDHLQAFYITANEVAISQKDPAFVIYRVFGLGDQPQIFILEGDIQHHVHLEPVSYRASLNRSGGL